MLPHLKDVRDRKFEVDNRGLLHDPSGAWSLNAETRKIFNPKPSHHKGLR